MIGSAIETEEYDGGGEREDSTSSESKFDVKVGQLVGSSLFSTTLENL